MCLKWYIVVVIIIVVMSSFSISVISRGTLKKSKPTSQVSISEGFLLQALVCFQAACRSAHRQGKWITETLRLNHHTQSCAVNREVCSCF